MGDDPNIARWSLDHHVLTLSLLHEGYNYDVHTPMFDRFFALLEPRQCSEASQLQVQVVQLFLTA